MAVKHHCASAFLSMVPVIPATVVAGICSLV
jgi:hypothetical protein